MEEVQTIQEENDKQKVQIGNLTELNKKLESNQNSLEQKIQAKN